MFKPRDVVCADCGQLFTIRTGTQLACRKNGWDLPKRCQQCKEDLLLINGAIGALRDSYPFGICGEITQRGFFFPEKVVLVKRWRTRELVAEVKMDEHGFLIDVHRVAEAHDANSSKRISYTREGREGLIESGFCPRRTAETYDADGNYTHRTRREQRGLILPRTVLVTRRADGTEVKP